MPITVHGPDEQEFEFPDDTSPETIKSVMAKHYGAPKTDTSSIPNPPQPEPQPEESLGSKASRFIQGALTGGHTFEDLGRGIGVIKDNPGKLADLAEQQVRSATAPVGGDTVAAAGAALAGKGFDPGAQRERRQELEAEMGTAATLIPKTLGGVGGFGRLPGGAAVQGATGGAIAGVNETGDLSKAAQEAALGAVGGKLAEGIVQVGGKLIANTPLSGIPKAVRALADRLKQDPRELVAIRKQLMQDTGREVSWAEAADPKTVERFRGMSLARPEMAAEAGVAREAADVVRPQNLANFVENGQMTGNAAGAEAARTDQFTRMMGKQANRPVTITNPEEFDVAAVNGGLKKLIVNTADANLKQSLTAFRDSLSAGGSPTIRLRDVENVRKVVADAVARDPGLTETLGPIRDKLRAIAEKQVPAYGTAMRTFERLGDFAEGTRTGAAAATPSASTTDLVEAASRANGPQSNGIAVGFRTKLKDDMLNSAGRAPEAYAGPGFKQRAKVALDQPEADRIAKGFAGEVKAARNLERLDTSPGAEANPLNDVNLAAKGAAALSGRFSGGAIADLVTKSWGRLRSLGLSNGAARDLSKSFFSQDPVQNRLAARQLEKLGIIKDATDRAAAIAALVGSQSAVAAAEQ